MASCIANRRSIFISVYVALSKELHLLRALSRHVGKNRALAFEKMQSFISHLYANKSQNLIISIEDCTGPSADGGYFLVDPMPLSPVDWRIALCVWR
ncbi:hypothetical protein [Escherichia coli]|uniref:hypothetical protein n=1 Tax=Escherichia coli TaxID=562 RepID=UPI0035B583AE